MCFPIPRVFGFNISLINRLGPTGFSFLVVTVALLTLPLTTQAVAPPPDGGDANRNTAEGENALFSLTTGFDNVAIGYEALFSNTSGILNTGSGYHVLYSNTTGTRNTATGNAALSRNTTGGSNTADGLHALFLNSTGLHNTGVGAFALNANTLGSENIAVGYNAGSSLTTGSDNIDIGNVGVASETGKLRIGTSGKQNNTYVAGIYGATEASGLTVVIGPDGHLGTISSSARFKEAIRPIDKASEAILALNPVAFRYKEEFDHARIPQFGLVAEEVEKVNPDLVVRDPNGKAYTVRYDAVNAMLLNEFLKEHGKVQELEKQVAALTAGLQRVTAQIQSSKLRPTHAAVKQTRVQSLRKGRPAGS